MPALKFEIKKTKISIKNTENIICKVGKGLLRLFLQIEIYESIISIFWWLFKSFVVDHIVFKRNEKIFDGGCVLPSLKKG
jgi:hypothetical protein